jgi:branched-chain amino acid transport system permease protein
MSERIAARLFRPWLALPLVAAIGVAADFVALGTVQIWSFAVINILLAQSINLLTGVAGQISLGHAGFLAIGAYASALLMKTWNLPLPLTVALAAGFGAVSGWLLSFAAGRVREFYLAMMTLGFGMIMYEVAREWNSVTGGMMGLSGIPSPNLKNLRLMGWSIGPVDYFRLMLVVLFGITWALQNFVTSHYGRALFAIHLSELTAGSIGVPRSRAKRQAYTLSAALAGLAGGFYAHLIGYLGPETFGLHRSVEVLVMAIVGGLGTLVGPVVGAIVFTYLPERLQIFAEYQFMVYGLILLVSFIVLPRGIAGLLPIRTGFIKRKAAAASAAPAEMRSQAPVLPAGTEPLLRADNVAINFQGLRALDNVLLELRAGECLGLVGPNGSGKSTLVNIIAGLYRPAEGSIHFAGRNITGLPDHAVAQAGILRTFQDPRLISAFTVRENVILGAHRLYRHGQLAAALNLPSALREEGSMLAKVDQVIATAGLSEVADVVVNDLPYGEKRLVELARVLAAEPQIVLLDEPAAGLSDSDLHRLAALLRHLKACGTSVVLIEHHMEFLDDLVDSVVVLDSGRVIYRGAIAGMYRDPQVISAYLGSKVGREATHARAS